MKRILCVGDLDFDLFAEVAVIPQHDQKVSGRHLGQRLGGMAANTAVALCRLGGEARLLSAIGDDAAGAMALAGVAKEGVDVHFVARRQNCSTFACVVLLSPSGEKALIRLETDAYLPRINDVVSGLFDGISHVHSTYGDAALAVHVLRGAKARGLTTSVDLEPPDIRRAPEQLRELLPLTDTLFVNREAWASIGGLLQANDLPAEAIPREIIVTLGVEGSLRIVEGREVTAPGFPVATVDTTGAGDCFAGAYLLMTVEGGNPLQALTFANAAAALSTMDYGAQTALPDRDKVYRFLADTQAGKGRTIAR